MTNLDDSEVQVFLKRNRAKSTAQVKQVRHLSQMIRPVHTFQLISFTAENVWEAGKYWVSCTVPPQRVIEFPLWDLCVRLKLQTAGEAPTPHSNNSSSSRSESSPPSWLTLNAARFKPRRRRLVFPSWFKPSDNSLQPGEGRERCYFIMTEHEHIRLHKCTISWMEAKRSWHYHKDVDDLTRLLRVENSRWTSSVLREFLLSSI